MSTELPDVSLDDGFGEAGIPELSATGKRIELRRLERRLTKRQLAQRAGISRQQLWRVMTGKADITVALGARLAQVLEVDARWLADPAPLDGGASYLATATMVPGMPGATPPTHELAPSSWVAFVSDRDALARALSALPSDLAGAQLKRALLNAVEDVAAASAVPLPPHFFDLRRQVVNGER